MKLVRAKSVVYVTLCRVVSQIPLQRLVANKLATSWQLPRLQGSYEETCVIDLGKWHTKQSDQEMTNSLVKSYRQQDRLA